MTSPAPRHAKPSRWRRLNAQADEYVAAAMEDRRHEAEVERESFDPDRWALMVATGAVK